MSTPQQPTENEHEFHPIACNNCKRLHKCCDRKLPKCSGCDWRKVDCVYEPPKRATKKKANNSELNTFQWVGKFAITSSEPKISDDKQPLSDWIEIRKYMDYYFELLPELKFIEKKDLEILMMNDDDSLPNSKQIRTMFLCVVAHLTQILALDCADDTLNNAIEAVRGLFNEHTNFYVACSYALLACVEVGFGRVKNARFYLKFVDFYFEELPKEEQNTLYIINLKKLKSVTTVDAKFESSVSCVMRDCFDILGNYIGVDLPKEWKDFIAQDIDENNYILFIQMMHALMQIGKLNLNDEKTLRFYSETADMLFHGIRIRILTDFNKSPELVEESALKVVQLTESDLYVVAPGFLSNSVAVSSKVILHFVKMIELGHTKNSIYGPIDYYQVLGKCLRAMKIMGKRFRKVFLLHNSLIKEMESIVERQFYNTLNDHVSPTEDTGSSVSEFFRILSENTVRRNEVDQSQYERNVSNILQRVQLPTNHNNLM